MAAMGERRTDRPPLGVALVGCGAVAQLQRARIYPRVAALGQVVATCDPEVVRARTLAEMLAGGGEGAAPRPYAALDDVLADPHVEAVDICTPHPSHAELALRAIAAGKHVLVEKPLATTMNDGKRMVAAAHAAGVVLARKRAAANGGAVPVHGAGERGAGVRGGLQPGTAEIRAILGNRELPSLGRLVDEGVTAGVNGEMAPRSAAGLLPTFAAISAVPRQQADGEKRQMRWTPRGAHLLLQVRTGVLNDELAGAFHRWYAAFTYPSDQREVAAQPPRLFPLSSSASW
jgi:hypothetical protein